MYLQKATLYTTNIQINTVCLWLQCKYKRGHRCKTMLFVFFRLRLASPKGREMQMCAIHTSCQKCQLAQVPWLSVEKASAHLAALALALPLFGWASRFGAALALASRVCAASALKAERASFSTPWAAFTESITCETWCHGEVQWVISGM